MANTVTIEAILETDKVTIGLKDIKEGLEGVGSKSEESSKKTSGISKAFSSLSVAAGNVLSNVVSKGFHMVVDSIDDAIDRVDTLNQFPKVMENIGFSAEDAQGAIDKMSDGIEGLPTTLDDIVSNTQQMALSIGDLDKATDVTLALNDGFITFGASSSDVTNAITQLNQMITAGSYDMQSWNSINQAAPGFLDTVARSMLGSEASASQLRDALNDGTVSSEDFMEAIVDLDKNGSDGVTAFSKAAKDASGGIKTSMSNAKNAITKNVANIINSLNKNGGIEKIFDNIKEAINKVGSFFSKNATTMVKAIKLIVTALAPWVLKNSKLVTSQDGVVQSFKNWVKQSGVLQQSSKKASAQIVAQTVKTKALSAASSLAKGALISLASMALVALISKIKESIDHYKDVKKATEGYEDATKLLGDSASSAASSLDSTLSKSLKEMKEEYEDVLQANVDLVDSVNETWSEAGTSIGMLDYYNGVIQEYANQSDLTAVQQGELKTAIEYVNEQLGTEYEVTDAVNGIISDTPEAIQKAIQAKQDQIEAEAAYNVALSLQQQMIENRTKLDQIASDKEKLLAEASTAIAEGRYNDARKLMRSYDELTDEEEELNTTLESQNEQYKSAQDIYAEVTGCTDEQTEAKKELKDATDEEADSEESAAEKSKQANETTSVVVTGSVDKIKGKYDEWKLANEEVSQSGEDLADQTETNMEDMEGSVSNSTGIMALDLGTGRGAFSAFATSVAQSEDDAASAAEDSATRTENAEKTKSDSVTSSAVTVDNALGLVGNRYDGLATSIEENAGDANEATASIGEEAEGTADTVSGSSSSIVTVIMNAVDQIIAKLSQIVEAVNNATGSYDGMGQSAQVAGDTISIASEGMVTTAEGTSENVSESNLDLQDSYSDTKDNVESNVNDMTSIVNSGCTDINNQMSGLGDKVQKAGASKKNKSAYNTVGTAVSAGAKKGVSSAVSTVSSTYIGSLGSKVKSKGAGGAAKSQYNQVGKAVGDGAKHNLPTALENAAAKLKSLGQKVYNVGTNGTNTSRYNSVGTSVGQGISSGMGSFSFVASASTVVSNLVGSVKSALGINSPSRLFRDEVGKAIPEGIALGIKQSMDLPYKELEKLSDLTSAVTLDDVVIGVSSASISAGKYDYLGELGLETSSTSATIISKLDDILEGVQELTGLSFAVNLDGKTIARSIASESDKISGTRLSYARRGLAL